MDQPLGDKVMKDIKSDFVVQGTHRVHNWYAYAIIGIVLGMAIGIIYVANRNAKFSASDAAMMPPTYETTSQYTAPMEGDTTVFDRFLSIWQEEHGGQTPENVIVRPGTLIIREGENNDTVQLGDPQMFQFSLRS